MFFVVFSRTPLNASAQNCGEPKSSIMHYAFVGHAYNTSHIEKYPSCMMRCIEDKKCASCNYDLKSQRCELNNATKVMAPDKFVKKDYFIYTEKLMY